MDILSFKLYVSLLEEVPNTSNYKSSGTGQRAYKFSAFFLSISPLNRANYDQVLGFSIKNQGQNNWLN